ncbi:MAG: hypothetical protein HY556_11365 [Euryarchaeota archaeon]|nr:hypothetical protein [Euryarchaeota archaeon]
MAKGVSEHFVKIMDGEGRSASRGLVAFAGLGAATYFLAELSDPDAYGANVKTFAAALGLGAALGALYAYRTFDAYAKSLRAKWDHWMRDSVGSATLGELAAKVNDREPPSAWRRAVAASIFIVGNAAFFIAMWLGVELGGLATAFAGIDGLLVGALAGKALWTIYWTRSFDKAVEELIGSGRVGVWGDR